MPSLQISIPPKNCLAEYCGFARRQDLLSPEWDAHVLALESFPPVLGSLDGWRHHWSRRWEFPWAVHAISSYLTSKQICGRILEGGCGVTPLPFWLATSGHNVTGVDLDQSCLDNWAAARRQVVSVCGSADFKIGDMEHLPEQSSFFDVTYSVSAIEHTNDPPQAVREMIRVTAPGGLVVLTCDVDILDSGAVTPAELADIQHMLSRSTRALYAFQATLPQCMLTFEQRTIAPVGRRRRAVKGLFHSVGLKSRADAGIFAYAGIRLEQDC